MWLILSFVLFIITLYHQLFIPYFYWQRKKIPHVKPWPIVGNMLENCLGTRSFAHIIQHLYDMFPDKRYFGFHHYSKPTIILKDPDLIKQVCLTDFAAFMDHPPFLPEEADPVLHSILLFMKGKPWSTMRANLAPTFTTGKLTDYFGFIMECSRKFTTHLENYDGTVKINVRDTFSRYTNDVSASLFLGATCDSFKDTENELFMTGKRIMGNETPLTFLKYFGCAAFPTLMKLLKVTFIAKGDLEILRKTVFESIRSRRENGFKRLDLIDLLLQIQQGRLEDNTDIQNTMFGETEIRQPQKHILSDTDIFLQAISLYLAAYDTTTNLMAALTYTLAINENIQKKLAMEVDETLKKCNGQLTYSAILNMKYMDMVVSETLRLWPVTTFSDRVSTKPYTIQPKRADEVPLQVDIDTYIWLPIYAIHRDPKYFPNPDKFDPERFSDNNRKNIQQYSYMPFGLGPRICIASRLALLMTKVIIFGILSKFIVVSVEETEVPLILSKKNINLVSDSGPILGLQLRKDL